MGRDRDECLNFLLAVKKEAFAKWKERDDVWIARLAESHMGGEALVWYEDLDQETQDSWKLLKRALLLRYPASSNVGCL